MTSSFCGTFRTLPEDSGWPRRTVTGEASQVILSSSEIMPDRSIQYEHLRQMRNHLVHGIEIPDRRDLREAAQRLDAIRRRLFDGHPPLRLGIDRLS